MKTIILFFAALLSTAVLYATEGEHFYGGEHDSLLFDGAQEITAPKFLDNDCILKVKHVKGKVYGTKYVMKSIDGDCITKEVKEMGTQYGLLKHEDVLVGGTEIKTDADSYLNVDLPDGSQIMLGPYSIIKIEDNWCGGNFFVRGGSFWTRIKRKLGAGEFEVSTERAVTGHRGTEYEIEETETATIIRVHEGIVEVEQKGTSGNTKDMYDMGKEMEKLTQDLQEGKITMDEFIKKTEELKKGSSSDSKDNLKKTVTGGYMITVTSTALMEDPVPLSGSTGWWENIMWDE